MTANPAFSHPDIDGIDGTERGEEDGQPDRLLAGKYKDVSELERGYDNLYKEGQRLVERIKALEERQTASTNSWSEGGEVVDRVSPSERRAQRQDPEDALSVAGIPVNELKQLVRQEIFSEISPVFQGAQARQSVAKDYPEFSQFEGELAQFVEANPQLRDRYNRAYKVDPEVALKWVYGEFTRGRNEPRGSASGEAQAAARLDASLPGRVSPPRAAPGEFNVDHYNKLREEAFRTGNWSRVLDYKLTIPKGHLDGLG